MRSVESKILNTLLDQYEHSKTFSGENKVSQSFCVSPSKLFPKYGDSAEYDFYAGVNDAVTMLEGKGFVRAQREKSGRIGKVLLAADGDTLPALYAYLGRIPRKQTQSELSCLLDAYSDGSGSPLQAFIAEQKRRIAGNKNVEHYDGTADGLKTFADILKGVQAVLSNEEELFVRDFSVRVYGDSKRFEKVRQSVTSVLAKYGDCDDGDADADARDSLLAEYGIVKTPTYICVKGNAVLRLGGQEIDLSFLHGDIAFSTESLKEISGIEVNAARVITVENLTSFHDYKNAADFVMYLGGFHNKVKRDFIRMLHAWNPGKEYLHFGDIDAGGFYILNHLRKRTGIPFNPMLMDVETLRKYAAQTKPLTQEDKRRLERMAGQEAFAPYKDVLLFMLSGNCKLEQENVFPAGDVKDVME